MNETVTATTPAFSGKIAHRCDRQPITLEGIAAASKQLAGIVATMVEHGSKRIDTGTVPCEEGFYFKVEGWR